MMVQANPSLNAGQIIERIKAGAVPFPVPATPPPGGECHVAALTTDSTGNYNDVQAQECQCTTTTCGAGMLNAPAALAASLEPQASIVLTPETAAIGQTVTLDGSTSSAASGSYLTAYHWTVDPGTAIANASSPVASLKFPALRPITVTLTVTDSAGRQNVASQVVNSKAFKETSGSGKIDTAALVILVMGVLGAFLRRRASAAAMLPARRPGAGPVDSHHC
jgi:serine protease